MQEGKIPVEFPRTEWEDYALLDSGAGEKLERFGSYVLRRPEPKALWTPSLPESEWARRASVTFHPGGGFSKAGKEDTGTWEKHRRMEDNWSIHYGDGNLHFTLNLAMTAFKHVGVFPEQAPNWDFIHRESTRLSQIHREKGKPAPKALNLFAYTGAASLAARCGGAEVTHLDSVRQVVSWASRNAQSSGMANGIHWVVEDACKFVRREVRRGNHYSMVILDPPAYGHGPDGERWKLDDLLFDLLRQIALLLVEEEACLVLNLYSNGYTPALAETIALQALGDTLHPWQGVEAGELALRDSFGKSLPLSVFVRLKR